MNTLHKFAVLTLSAVLTVCLLAGCGASASSTASSAASSVASSVAAHGLISCCDFESHDISPLCLLLLQTVKVIF